MEARELVARMLADLGGEGAERCRVLRLQPCEGLQIRLEQAVVGRLRRQWLVDPERLGSAPQQEIADRTAAKIRELSHDAVADQNARAKWLVRRLEPRRHVDRVAVGCVVEEAVAAEIP